jgi:hypothetical protein
METETWKDVVGYEGFYQVSDLGRVRSLERAVKTKRNGIRIQKENILHGSPRRGRPSITLCNGRKEKLFFISNLVLLAFVGPRPEGHECCHFPDRDVKNNKLSNLFWGSKKENQSHRLIHGTDVRGEKNYAHKITKEQAVTIKKMLLDGISLIDIHRKTKIKYGIISMIKINNTWSWLKV